MLDREDLKRGGANFTWLMAGSYASYALSFLTVVFIARKLGPTSYGEVNAAVAYVGLFAFLKLPGFDKVYVRDAASRPDKREEDYSVLLGVKLASAILGMAAAAAILPLMPFGNDERLAVLAFGTTILTQPIATLMGAVFQGCEDMKWMSVVGFIRQASYIVAASAGLYLLHGGGVRIVAVALTGSYWLGLALSYWAVRRYLPRPLRPTFRLPERPALKSGIVFSAYSVLVYLYTKVDVLLARTFLGPAAAGLY